MIKKSMNFLYIFNFLLCFFFLLFLSFLEEQKDIINFKFFIVKKEPYNGSFEGVPGFLGYLIGVCFSFSITTILLPISDSGK